MTTRPARGSVSVDSRPLSQRLFSSMKKAYYERLAESSGAKVAWLGFLGPTELAYAFDLLPYCVETDATEQGARGQGEPLVAAAEQLGYSRDLCSYVLGMIGVGLSGLRRKPDIIWATSHICESGPKYHEVFAHQFGVPWFMLDSLWRYDDEAALAYVRELEELIAFTEAQLGLRLDRDRLRECVNLAAEAHALAREIQELRVATPFRVRDGFKLYNVHLNFSGTPEAVAFYRALRDELTAQASDAEARAEEAKRRRLLFWGVPAFCILGLLDWIEERFPVRLVTDEMSQIWWPALDAGRPLDYIARRSISHWSNQPAEARVQLALDAARKFRAEGAIIFNTWGCRRADGSRRILKEALMRDAGIPSLLIESDGMDPRNAGEEQLRGRIEGFLELLR